MVKIKICGLRRREDIEIINKYAPDYIGFVFAESKRQIDFETAKQLKSFLKVKIPVVGVFVDAEIEDILNLYRNDVIDMAQLHGNENEQYISKLKELEPSLKLIKAIEIKEDGNLEEYEELDVDYLLLDSGKGSGKTFNWDLINKNIGKDFFLAGGLNSNNIKSAIDEFHPYAIDLSSGVEVNGYKNEEKIREVMEVKNE
ncbi:MAG: phosphoribosylanthranilate isomerase [Methanobrevibacter sp.]|uniref:phosphoribosylanthranilate isomerase n=1 Tax=Methanobrevibacter sp. TaxID=66852 RepID=UPI0026DEA50F|nr:phosphoribosylanthranilate isomerase [Methanobrevibacter sp.]MDO5848006.1 phosphoribosylanthranilate isomerase [Methanobrevibacter sp.]